MPENSIVLLEEKSTVPLGLVAVPVSVSETTASQVPVWPRRITDAQVTEVEVARSVACEEFAEAVPSHNTPAAPTTTATTARAALRNFPGLLIDLRHTLRPLRHRAKIRAMGRDPMLARDALTRLGSVRRRGRYVVALVTPAAQAMKDVVRDVTPLLRGAGFRKRRHTFNRTPEPGLVHVLNFQMGEFNPPGPGSDGHVAASNSPASPGYLYGRFTINLGVHVAGMDIEGGESRSWVNHSNCQLRKRLGELLTGQDVWWSLESPAEIASVVEMALTLAGLPWLDRFSDTSSIVDAFRSEGGAALGLPPVGPLQIACLLKDTEPDAAEALIRSYLSQDLHSWHREGVERQLRAAGFGHLLDPT